MSFDLSAAGSLLVSGFNTLGGGPAGDDYYAAATVNAVAEHGTCSVTGAKLGDANGGNVSGGGLSYTCAVDPALRSVPEPAPLVLLGAAALASVPATRRLASVRRRLALVHG